MKLGVSQRPVQSDDAVNVHPSRAELSYLSNAASRRVPSYMHGGRGGGGVEIVLFRAVPNVSAK